ncbi:MAG TPA: phosphotransferase [Tabrizicola sp.]|nr:phosphotransferase [Tabrizicola sp.]
MVDRQALAQAFLLRIGWAETRSQHLAGDASDRSYARLFLGDRRAVLMDSPPGGVDDIRAFVAMDRHLRGLGLSAPAILAEDLETGFLLLEDLGDGLYARLLTTAPEMEHETYAAAVDVLAHLQAAAPPAGLPDLTAGDWARAAGLVLEHYVPAASGAQPDPAPFLAALEAALTAHADGARVLILRDFHAENLLWLPGRQGLARVGLLDFQLGQMGQRGYDLVSLLQDARRDVAPETETAMIARFVAVTDVEPERFAAEYAVLGAQRALRILGIFARLCVTGGKPTYLRLIPRVWTQLWRNLNHPALADLRQECLEVLPEPTTDCLKRMESQCPTSPSR